MDPAIFSHEIGDGLPILIIHGWEMEGKVEEWDLEPVFSQIPGLRRIYIDLPGMGQSPANGIQNLDDIFHRLAQFVDARLGTAKFLLTGSSCGGYLARALARKYRDQVDGLLLRVSVIDPDRSKRDLDPFVPVVANEEVVTDEDKAAFGNILVQTGDYVKALKTKFEAVLFPAMKAADTQTLEPLNADPQRYVLSVLLEESQARLLAPTLIVCGRHDPTVGFRDALRLLDSYPRSTFAVLDRGEHYLPLDEKDLFSALVTDWITRVYEWRAVRERQSV